MLVSARDTLIFFITSVFGLREGEVGTFVFLELAKTHPKTYTVFFPPLLMPSP